MTADADRVMTDTQPGDDLARTQVALRRAELRLAGLRHQLDLRLQRIQQLTAERDRAGTLADERDQARAELAALMATRTFRYSRMPRRLYGALRTAIGRRS